MRCLTRQHTGFQEVEVWASAREAEFRVAGAIHAWWHRDRYLTGLAWDNLAAASLLRLAGPPRSVLLLGVAGGTTLRVLRHLWPAARFTGVEIDPGILDLARRHLHLDELDLTLHEADAYEWIRARGGPAFDVVIDDVYQALPHDVARPGAYSSATVAALRRRLAPGGLLVVNLVIGRGHRAMQSAFRRFFRETFPVVRSVTTPDSLNEALVGGEGVLAQAALRPWRERFPDARDRAYWDRLRVRALRVAE